MSNDFDMVKHGEIHKPSYLQALFEMQILINEEAENKNFSIFYFSRDIIKKIQELIDNCK